ncbi:MAG: Ig-like domain-containing protein [Gracilibacteraceae bacterium]|jgi:hypothetical protein|nr:Ig-like domain-containing protein [Gracilibacteraceae bacterium]
MKRSADLRILLGALGLAAVLLALIFFWPGEPEAENGREKTSADPSQPLVIQPEGPLEIRSVRPAANSDYNTPDTDIALGFSRPVGSVAEWAEITPALPGLWRQNGLSAVFLPQAALAADTLYTVTLRAGLPGLSGEPLAEDYTFSFRTDYSGARDSFLEINGEFSESFLVADPVAVRFTALSDGFTEAPVTASVYRVADSAAYVALALDHAARINAWCGRESDALVLPAAAAGPETLIDGVLLAAATQGVYYFLLPENPGPGYYLLDLTIRGRTATVRRQKLICVSDLAVYWQSLGGHTEFWLNDAASGRPLVNATVAIAPADEGEPLRAVSNADGLAALDTDPAGGRLALTIQAADGRDWADACLFPPMSAAAEAPSRLYYTYLYFDRPEYLSADTARFWGFTIPRREGGEPPAEVVVAFPGLPPQTVPVTKGAFSGEFTWAGAEAGRYEAELAVEGETVLSRPLRILSGLKPAYTIRAAADKAFYRQGEAAALTARAAWADGTPAAGLRLTAESRDISAARVADAAGRADFSLAEAEPASWRPYREAIDLRAEEAGVQASATVAFYRFPTDYICTVRAEATPGGFYLEADTARIDFTAAEALLAAEGETAATAVDFAARIQGEPYEQYFDAGIVRREYVREETGEYYDFLQKTPVKQYRYTYRETLVERLSFSTAGGRWRSGLLPWPTDGSVSYQINLDYETPDGVTLRESISVGADPRQAAVDYYFLETDSREFSPGERLSLNLGNAARPLPPSGRLFYSVLGDETVVAAVTAETGFSLYCAEGLLPDFRVSAAYFDGKHIFSLEEVHMTFRAAERELRVAVRPERETYEPGERVKAEIRVTDALGQPRAASFFLSVTDEAAFAPGEEGDPTAVAILYRPLEPVGGAARFASYRPHSFSAAPGAGDGDEGGEMSESGGSGGTDFSRRQGDFLSPAAFVRGQTDGGGRAEISFSLPDQAALWRLTAVACTEDGYAGAARATVRASSPLALRPVLSERYTTADDIVLVLRTDGAPAEAAVVYTARLESGSAAVAEQTVRSGADGYAVCNFGKLPAGAYTFRLAATAGPEARAEAIRPFSVAASLVETPLSLWSDVAGLAKLQDLTWPVDLIFYDRSHELYVRALVTLAGAAGARADERLAGEFARAALAQGFTAGAPARPGGESPGAESAAAAAPADADRLPVDAGRLPAAYVSGGGLSLLPSGGPDGQPDCLLTAKAVAAAPASVDPEQTRAYFYDLLYRSDATPAETAAAYLGLAALGAPVLTDIQTLLPNRAALFTLRDCLRLSTALALLGDRAGAATWYEEFIAPLVRPAGGALVCDAGLGDEAAYALTAEAAVPARLLGRAQADGLLTYVLEREDGEYSPLLDIMAALRFTPEPDGGEAELRYQLEGKDITIDLGAVPFHCLRLGAEQFAAADFRSGGDAGVAVLYSGGAADLDPDTSGRITVAKSYAPAGAFVRVTIDVRMQNNAPLALYTLTDVLPAGLRFAAPEPDEQGNWYLSGEEEGRVDFVLSRVREQAGARVDILADFQVTYLARVALPGEFLADSAVVRHAESELCAVSVPRRQSFRLMP